MGNTKFLEPWLHQVHHILFKLNKIPETFTLRFLLLIRFFFLKLNDDEKKNN